MTSNSSFNLPGLGHLGQSSNGGNSINTTTTNNMGSEGSVGEKKGGNGVSSSETKPESSQASAFGQRPPGTSTYVCPPLLPPPTGNARPSFGTTANVGDISARSSLPQTGFAQFANKAGNSGGTFYVGCMGSTSNFGEGTSSAFALPSATVVPSASNSQLSLASEGLQMKSPSMVSSVKPTETVVNTSSVGNNMAQETNVGVASTATQNVSSFDQASRSSFSTSLICTRRDSSSGDERANPKLIPPANTASRAMPVKNKTTEKASIDASIAAQKVSSFDSASHKSRESQSSLSTAMVRTGHDSSNGDNRANFGPISSTSPGQEVSTHPNPSGFISPGDSELGMIDVSKISPEAAMFCFGVLATQGNFAPRFEYTYGGGGLWGTKLTFWGHTIVKKELAEGKLAAKAAICRKALDALKPQFKAWMMPDLPAKCSTSTACNWPHVLEKHCFQVGFDTPVYTKYLNGDGYRFEVEISGVSYFGMLKYYRSESEAKNASAHLGLYSVLVNNVEETSIFPGASFLRAGFANKWDEHEPPGSRASIAKPDIREAQSNANAGDPIPANGVVANEQNVLVQNTNNAQASTSTGPPSGQGQAPLSKGQKARRNKKNRRLSLSMESFPPLPPATGNPAGASNGSKKQKTMGSMGNSVLLDNPNPFPDSGRVPGGPTRESHPWLSEFAGSAGKRWNVPTKSLKWASRNCASQKERVAILCGLLALQDPEYNLDIYNRGFGASEYYAAAFFPNDPFLARAGAIGQIRYTHGKRLQAHEDCAREVADYLIDMVEKEMREDIAGEDVYIKTEPEMMM